MVAAPRNEGPSEDSPPTQRREWVPPGAVSTKTTLAASGPGEPSGFATVVGVDARDDLADQPVAHQALDGGIGAGAEAEAAKILQEVDLRAEASVLVEIEEDRLEVAQRRAVGEVAHGEPVGGQAKFPAASAMIASRLCVVRARSLPAGISQTARVGSTWKSGPRSRPAVWAPIS